MIKLRAWCEDHNEMYFADNEYIFQIHDSRIVYRPIRNVNDFNFFTDKPHFEDEIGIIVEQFTGLLDRNGKEIYEGDILRIDQGHQEWLSDAFIVTFVYGSFGIDTKPGDVAFRTYLDQCRTNIPHKVCYEQSMKLNRDGLLVKMYLPLLHQNLNMFSSLYAHRWKIKGTKFNRLIFQLRLLEASTDEKEFGLLPTPAASDNRNRGSIEDECNRNRLATGRQVGLSTLFKGIPCPICVAHIMGFPEDWLSKPFMDAEMLSHHK